MAIYWITELPAFDHERKRRDRKVAPFVFSNNSKKSMPERAHHSSSLQRAKTSWKRNSCIVMPDNGDRIVHRLHISDVGILVQKPLNSTVIKMNHRNLRTSTGRYKISHL